MGKPDVSLLAKQMIDAVRGFVARSESAINIRLDALEAHVKAIPAAQKGDKGEPGRDGADGKPGESIKGEKGDSGDRGADGKPGESIKGEKGDKGEPGVGVKGDKGDPGVGVKGDPGRDALAIDILPAIDEAKSYPRGTWARHANGIWRAAGDTLGMRNWECMVAGVYEFAIDLKDERTITLGARLSTGESIVKDFSMPVVLDRGVYVPEREYAKGDGVTWGGSWWIAQADKPTDKPGVSDQWRLAVKRGRDGKDAK